MTEPAYKRFPVYQAALTFYSDATVLIVALPKGNSDIADQLKRAAQSIVLNIAEGSGKFMRRDKARFYLTASGSAYECGAILDILVRSGLMDDEEHQRLNNDLNNIAGGLVLLAKAVAG